MVPAHERIREPERKARALKRGSLLPPWSMTNCFKGKQACALQKRPSGALPQKVCGIRRDAGAPRAPVEPFMLEKRLRKMESISIRFVFGKTIHSASGKGCA